MNLFIDCTPSTTPNHTIIHGVYTAEDAINWAIQSLDNSVSTAEFKSDWVHYRLTEQCKDVTVPSDVDTWYGHSLEDLLHTFFLAKCPIEVDMKQWVDAVGKQFAFDEGVTVHNNIIRKCLVQGDY
jgi:hypothetical protein